MSSHRPCSKRVSYPYPSAGCHLFLSAPPALCQGEPLFPFAPPDPLAPVRDVANERKFTHGLSSTNPTGTP